MPELPQPQRRERTGTRSGDPTKYKSSRWKKASKAFRKKHFFCEVWLALGRPVKANCTDHIVRFEDGGAFWDQSNWMPMSNFWHSRKSTMESNGLKLQFTETRGGKIPKDRQEIIKILAKKYKREIDMFT